jgi:hypothetical protein
MEIRQTFPGGGVRKGLIVLAACAAVGAAVAGAAITKDLTSSVSSSNGAGSVAQGSVLRQDGPIHGAPALLDRNAERQVSAPAAFHAGRSSGTQSVEGSNAASLTGAAQGSGAGQPLSSCEFVDKHKAC